MYCGNNQVWHRANWYYTSADICLGPIRRFLVYNPITQGIEDAFEFLFKKSGLSRVLFNLALKLKILSVNTEREKCPYYRPQVLWEEAERRGLKFSEIRLFGKPMDVYRVERDGNELIFNGMPRAEGSDYKLLEQIDDKLFLKKLLAKHDLPVGKGGSAWRYKQAKKIFDSIPKPVIVKPRIGSRGRHSTTFIYTEDQLKKAFQSAKKICHWVIVEEQFFGPVYRGTVINFKTVGMLLGEPPSVVGNGRSTIQQLVEDFNSSEHPGQKNIVLTKKNEEFLERQGLSLKNVLKAGERIFLTEKIGVSYGGTSSEDYHITHPDNLELCERAARALNDKLVGFDFIIPDISKSYKEQRMGFIEVNSLPFINLHHDPLLGEPRNVAKYVWDLIGF